MLWRNDCLIMFVADFQPGSHVHFLGVLWSVTGMVVPRKLALSHITFTSFMGAKDENTFSCRDECWCLMALGAGMCDYNSWVEIIEKY